MLRLFTAAALLAASPTFAVTSGNYGAQNYNDPFYHSQNESRYNYQENPAFTQGCPTGSIPESFPNGNGRRCALPGGGYSY